MSNINKSRIIGNELPPIKEQLSRPKDKLSPKIKRHKDPQIANPPYVRKATKM